MVRRIPPRRLVARFPVVVTVALPTRSGKTFQTSFFVSLRVREAFDNSKQTKLINNTNLFWSLSILSFPLLFSSLSLSLTLVFRRCYVAHESFPKDSSKCRRNVEGVCDILSSAIFLDLRLTFRVYEVLLKHTVRSQKLVQHEDEFVLLESTQTHAPQNNNNNNNDDENNRREKMTLTMMRTTSGIAGTNNRTTKNNFISRRKGGGFGRHGVNKGVSFSSMSTRITNANAGSVFFPSTIQTTTTREEVKDKVKEKVEKENKGRAILDGCKKQSSTHVFTVAATTMVDKKMVALITQSVASFIKLYLLLLFVRVLLTWFPNVNWMRQPWTMLRQVTDPYLNLFRNLIPPIMGQIDFTPILGFMVLQFLARVLSTDPSLGRF